MSKTIICDLDGTLCSEEKTFSRSLAEPIIDEIRIINDKYLSGNTIVIFTARSWAEYDMTYKWLRDNNVNFHRLICGKPTGDVFIDDRSFKSVEEYEESCRL